VVWSPLPPMSIAGAIVQYIKGSLSPPHPLSRDHPLPHWMPPILLLLKTFAISVPWHQAEINNDTSTSKPASLKGLSRQKQRGWQRGSYQLGGGGGSLAEAQLWRRPQHAGKRGSSATAAAATWRWQWQYGIGEGGGSGGSVAGSAAAAEAA
jgi:hypothetical protein